MKDLFSLFLGLSLLLSISLPVSAQSPRLDQLFSELQARGSFNGNVIVARKGKILYQKSFGFADYATQRMLNDSSVFELASVGKQFTAMGILLLAEAGKLQYTDQVITYLSDFPYENITIHQLLTHTSGLPDYVYHASHWAADQIATNADVRAFLRDSLPVPPFVPGEDFAYSNTNYVLLAEIIREVSGQSFGDFLQEQIFTPLGLRHTRTYRRWAEEESLANYAVPHVSYTNENDVRVYVDPVETHLYPLLVAGSGIEGDGNIVSTTGDLVRWYEAVRTNQLVSAETMQRALSPTRLNDGTYSEYGYGMYIGKKGKKCWHWGSWPGVQSSYTFFPETGTVAIYLKNVESHDWSWINRWEKAVQ